MKPVKILGMMLVLVIATMAQSDRVIRVRFPKGEIEVELKGTLKGKAANIYLVRAKEGQTMTVQLEVNEDEYASMQIRQPNGVTIDSENDADSGTQFSNTLPMTGDYKIIIFPPETADRNDMAHFKLKISFHD